MDVQPERSIVCPFCFETIQVVLDLFDGDSPDNSSRVFVYDCEVCCRPIELSVSLGASGDFIVEASREY